MNCYVAYTRGDRVDSCGDDRPVCTQYTTLQATVAPAVAATTQMSTNHSAVFRNVLLRYLYHSVQKIGCFRPRTAWMRTTFNSLM